MSTLCPTACGSSLDPLNVSCTVPLRSGVAVSDSSSCCQQCCTLDRILCRSSALLFDDPVLIFTGQVCFFSIERPFFSMKALLFDASFPCSFLIAGKLCCLRQPSFVLSAAGLETLFLCFKLNNQFQALVDLKMALLPSIRSIPTPSAVRHCTVMQPFFGCCVSLCLVRRLGVPVVVFVLWGIDLAKSTLDTHS